MSEETKNKAAVELGKLGGQKTAERGPEYYAEIQAKRKNKGGGRPRNPRKATHKGILRIGDTELPVFVLEDETRVISGRGMTAAIGMKGRGQGTARIAALLRQKISNYNELAVAIENPLVFDSGAPMLTQGYEADVLVELCGAILDARDNGALKTQEEHRYADACYMLTRAFAKVGVIALVDEATGYQYVRARLALEEILEKFIAHEFKKWAKRFPDDFYREIFRLRKWDFKEATVKRTPLVGKLTTDLVYDRLAPGVRQRLELLNPKDEHGRRRRKHFQWLTEDVGDPALREHLASVIALMKASDSWPQFAKMLNRALPRYLPAPLFDSVNESEAISGIIG